MISVLLPSRGRPHNVRRVVESARATASGEVEFVIYLDDDDTPSHDAARDLEVEVIVGPRVLLSETWNRCWERARFDVAMHCGDDIVFRTPGWDARVLDAFNAVPDRIALVWGRDGFQDLNMSTHGFLHRRWVETVGYFVPPYFASDYNDAWLYEVAGALGRRVFLPDVLTEHMHPVAGKAPMDQTHHERLQRHAREDCDRIWRETEHLRRADVAKLRRAIEEFKDGER